MVRASSRGRSGSQTTTTARLGETSAREVLLLQAFESIEPPTPVWSTDDAAWATRAAREAEASLPAAKRGGAAFLASRAALAMQRLLPREPAVADAWRLRVGLARHVGVAVVLGAVAGLAVDAIGSSQRINLLAPPVWTVVAWNLVVYLSLIGAAARSAFAAPRSRPGPFARIAGRLAGARHRWPGHGEADTPSSAALRSFAGHWAVVAAPLVGGRALVLLHVAAAALAVGLIGGLYARGLVLDYRVAWESTFLAPADVHAVLSTLLAPASRVSGIALPDVAAVAALRAAHGGAAVGAPAAPWIHLYALTLAMSVVLPRAALAAFGAASVRHAAATLRLPLDDAYFRRLAFERRGDVARVALRPYAQAPAAAALAGARLLLADVFGDGVRVEVAPTTPFGAEDDGPDASAGATVAVALFDLGATPEPEHQGRFVAALAARSAAGGSTVVLVDETAFRRRFGRDARRVTERRAAWSALLATHGTVPVFADLEAPDRAAAADALRRAIAAPARAA